MKKKDNKIVNAIIRKHDKIQKDLSKAKDADMQKLVKAMDKLITSDPVEYAELVAIRDQYDITAEPKDDESKDISKLKKDFDKFVADTEKRLEALESKNKKK